jgi:ankyrin repeat protein
VNKADENGKTPLLHAVTGGYNETIVRLLLENHANIETADEKGNTPLHWAIRLAEEELVSFFQFWILILFRRKWGDIIMLQFF